MLAEEINKLNALLKELSKYGSDYKENIGKVVTNLPQQFKELFKKKIPDVLKSIFPEKEYKIKPAFGQGNVAGTPSISILRKTKPDDNPSPTSGVYLVFLFSPDLKETYFQLAMGVENKSIKEIIADVEEIREKLPIDSYKLLKPINDQKISNKKYKVATIYGNFWNVEDEDYCLNLLNELIKLYGEYLDSDGISEKVIPESKKREESEATEAIEEKESSKFSVDKVIKAIQETGLIYADDLIKRYAYSLLTKPFVILSGLSGSGKTQLALSFALTMVENQEKQICFVPVGADWTNREPLLGYPNALKPGEYVKPESGVLSILLEAQNNPQKPYFLILDEMNLSYVERYFADFLSAMEAKGMKINLWDNPKENESEKEDSSQLPSKITLPRNLFITGTINVDETTYMFSPKVLDRANVIEFKISEDEMEDFLSTSRNIELSKCTGAEKSRAQNFVKIATKDVSLDDKSKDILLNFFKPLKKVNAEFGYRTSTEIRRFISLAKEDLGIEKATDAAIVQKLLPKLHGSRRKIVPVLNELWKLSTDNDNLEVFMESDEEMSGLKYPLTADKIFRMYKTAVDNGFTSFAEA
ncbi:MAG: DUF3578 domain-containing protein [Muribaculaceae bacterium]|nr:DUF3578 domain-containing protein [Muribaculaceae bacterium]